MNTHNSVKRDLAIYISKALVRVMNLDDPGFEKIIVMLNKFDEHYDLMNIVRFITWAIRNEQDEHYILSTIIHDLGGSVQYDPTFSPKTNSWAEIGVNK